MNYQGDLFVEREKIVSYEENNNALDELFKNSKKYEKSKEFMDLLEFINKFPYLSPFNAFLVNTQDSSASIVLTESKWEKYGRKVKPSVRPYIIMIPFGPVSFVYNITDTYEIVEGSSSIPDSLINPFYTKGVLKRDVYDYTCRNSNKENIFCEEYEMKKNSAGYVTTRKGGDFNIYVNSLFDITAKYSTIVHELAHVYCGHLGNMINSWWSSRMGMSLDIKEIEAESVSYLVCRRLGLTTSSHEYLSNYIKEDKPLPNISIDRILTVANYIEKMGTKEFRSKNKKIK